MRLQWPDVISVEAVSIDNSQLWNLHTFDFPCSAFFWIIRLRASSAMMNNMCDSGHPYLINRQMQNLGESLPLMRIAEEVDA